MASIVFGCIVPHPPIIVPEVGREEVRRVSDTITSMETLADMLGEARPETLVVISPHGPTRRDAMGVSITSSSQGNLASFGAGAVRLSFNNDLDLVAALREECRARDVPLATIGSTARTYALDHGVVVPMYFLRRTTPMSALVPLTFSLLPYDIHYAFGQAIQAAADRVGRRVAVVASGDLSHRLIRGAAAGYDPMGRVLDKAIVDAVAAGDPAALMNIDQDVVERGAECGLRSIIILFGALDGMDIRPRVLSYEGPFGVGYMVAAVSTGAEEVARLGDETARTEAVSPVTQASKPAAGARSGNHPLVDLARRAVETYVLQRRHVQLPDALTDEMMQQAGVFVCLKKKGHLRGCIGTFEPTHKNVAEEIVHNAISSATQDPRFPRVSADELRDLTYTVDVLTAPEAINGIDQLDPKRYGVIVESGYRRGLLLPDLEGVDSADEQVLIARKKAGIRPNEPARLYRFEVKRYGEPVD